MTPTTLRFAYKAFSWPLPGPSCQCSASSEGKPPNCCIAGLQKRKSYPPRGLLRICKGRKREEERKQDTGRLFFFFLIFISIVFASDRGSPGPGGSAPGRRWSRACTCHFAREQEPHPPDTCQAAAQTPSGCPPRRPRARDRVSAPPPPRGGGGTQGTPGTPGAAPTARPAPPRCHARRPRRDAPGVPAPFPSLLSGPRRARSSPGQGQLFGAAVLRGVVLPRRRWRRRRWRGRRQ